VTGSGILLAAIVHIVLHALVATAIIAAADYAHSWFKLEKDMKMSLQELKDDMRSDDGDPHVKAKMRARARQNSKKRMMADVKSAAVIVTNPPTCRWRCATRAATSAVVVAKGHDGGAPSGGAPTACHLGNRRLARASTPPSPSRNRSGRALRSRRQTFVSCTR
jgi:flagellar biosynthesis protein FlhB